MQILKPNQQPPFQRHNPLFLKGTCANPVEKEGHQCPVPDDLPCPMSCFSMIENHKTGGAFFPQWDN